jgi:(R,R)-butanediol dehydrogenase/meso-butanediol dehydrogenase/diacetyl reductase
MRSAIFKAPGLPLSIDTVPDPTPAPNQVVIRIGRCGICGSDLTFTDPRSPAHYPIGSALGHEYAGEIVALGRDVTHLAIGDRVTAMPSTGCGSCAACLAGDPNGCASCHHIMGGYGEYTLADGRYAAKLPDSLSLDDGALVEPLACGSQAARLGGVTAKSRVLVIGAGPIGLAAVYWARRMGGEQIAAAALSDRNEAIARTMGASAFVRQGDDFAATVAEELGGAPDIVFECSGGTGTIGQAIEAVAPRGTVVAAGFCFEPQPIVTAGALFKQLRLQFSMAYTMDDFRHGIAALDAGSLEPRAMLSDTVSLDALPDTIEALRTDKTRCKVMVDPWG